MIRLQNVTKVYDGGVVAVKNASLEIAKGEFVFLVGPSGSGKSTLIRLMMREERPTDGDLWVAGKHASDLPSWKVPHLRRSIGTVFQDFKLLPNKTVYENVSFAMEVTGRPRQVSRTQVPQVLKLVGLSAKADRYPRQLSGGEQQRVSLARAFVNRPLIVLADEPTGNLDPGTSVGIMRILDRINRTGTTVVMATHDHAIVDAMRRRVIQLDGGHIVRDQTRGVYDRTAEGKAARQMTSSTPAASGAPPPAPPPPPPPDLSVQRDGDPEPVAETPVAETPVVETPTTETPVADVERATEMAAEKSGEAAMADVTGEAAERAKAVEATQAESDDGSAS
jgi:cell division transport system ATP-binding protein